MNLLSSILEGFLKIWVLLKDLADDNADLVALKARIDTRPGVPIQNPTTSFWLQDPPFPDLVDTQSITLPKTADVVIIGSGITGASIARTILSECASMGISRRVVMLEARQICSGATGRNGGHMKCTPYEAFSKCKERFGVERARFLVDFQRSHLPILVDLANQEEWESAEAREVETLDVFYDEQAWIEAQRMVEELRQGMPQEARNTFVWDKQDAIKVFDIL